MVLVKVQNFYVIHKNHAQMVKSFVIWEFAQIISLHVKTLKNYMVIIPVVLQKIKKFVV